MITYEDECVDCGLPCISGCRYKNVEVRICDACSRPASYHVEGKDLCETCFFYFVRDEIQELNLTDVADLLQIKYEKL